MFGIEDLPSEILENIFKHLPSATEQQNIRLVCKRWLDIVEQMRRTPPTKTYSTFDSLTYIRLPAAGSLNEIHGNKGFAVILHSFQEVIICGVAVFLPHAKENEQAFDSLIIEVKINEHGASQVGPVGQPICSVTKSLTKSEVLNWTGNQGCPRTSENSSKGSLQCLPGYFFLFLHNFLSPLLLKDFHICRSLTSKWKHEKILSL